MPRLELFPAGVTLGAAEGTALRDLLFPQGVEFPCGGQGRCRGCRVKLLAGALPVTAADRKRLSPEALAGGWRLSCQAVLHGDLRLEIAQWAMPILADDSHFRFTPRAGLGIAVDLGTTTVVAQLVDLASGSVLGVVSALNAQACRGGDVMTRIEFALGGGAAELTRAIRRQLGEMIRRLLAACSGPIPLRDVVIVGNSAMHQLCAGLSVESLARHPFEPLDGSLRQFGTDELDPGLPPALVSLLPCIGGFVGSDILAGVFATNLHRSDHPQALIDLGTNGEIVVGNRDRLLCASTAAGPAFEGARIQMGMRAATGAISAVRLRQNRLECQVLGGGEPRGICGSGLVDAVAAGLDLGAIQASGRFLNGPVFPLAGKVHLTQRDLRELQLAKSAVAAGLAILAGEWGIAPSELEAIHLAGAFGNYLNHDSARRIGLLPSAETARIVPAGNTALFGAKLALFTPLDEFTSLAAAIRHRSLDRHPDFQEAFVSAMSFPPVSSIPSDPAGRADPAPVISADIRETDGTNPPPAAGFSIYA